MFDLNTVRVTADAWDANGDKPGDGRCMVCNKPVKDDSPGTRWIWMAADSQLFPFEADEDAAAQYPYEDMGLQPVGSACSRKIPAAYRSKSNDA